MRGIAGFRNGNESGGSMGAGTRLKSQLSFSSRQSSSAGLMSQISENENENESIGGYPMASWEESPILSDNNFSSSGLKRPRDTQTDQSQVLFLVASHLSSTQFEVEMDLTETMSFFFPPI